MIYFNNDYNEICHPAIIAYMNQLQGQQNPGYGVDDHCVHAAELIRKACQNEELAVHFLVGGTQTNLTVIAASLRPHQAVLGVESAHINVHETGAIEATGHKVIAMHSEDGKLTAKQIADAAYSQSCTMDAEHTAQPKLVYISHPTELGTAYTLDEMESISKVCKQYGLYLFVDGARLGYALAAEGNDLFLPDLARLCDAFYIGGTKVGAMFGEAVVISNPYIAEDFRYLMKQRGGMLAKGWLLGAQYEVLFRDGLYTSIAAHANRMADQIRQAITDAGFSLWLPGTSNQIFAVLPDDVLRELGKDFTFADFERIDDSHRAVRFCTSWATTQENVDSLCNCIRRLSSK